MSSEESAPKREDERPAAPKDGPGLSLRSLISQSKRQKRAVEEPVPESDPPEDRGPPAFRVLSAQILKIEKNLEELVEAQRFFVDEVLAARGQSAGHWQAFVKSAALYSSTVYALLTDPGWNPFRPDLSEALLNQREDSLSQDQERAERPELRKKLAGKKLLSSNALKYSLNSEPFEPDHFMSNEEIPSMNQTITLPMQNISISSANQIPTNDLAKKAINSATALSRSNDHFKGLSGDQLKKLPTAPQILRPLQEETPSTEDFSHPKTKKSPTSTQVPRPLQEETHGSDDFPHPKSKKSTTAPQVLRPLPKEETHVSEDIPPPPKAKKSPTAPQVPRPPQAETPIAEEQPAPKGAESEASLKKKAELIRSQILEFYKAFSQNVKVVAMLKKVRTLVDSDPAEAHKTLLQMMSGTELSQAELERFDGIMSKSGLKTL